MNGKRAGECNRRDVTMNGLGLDALFICRLGNLVFLSARPHVYKAVSENVSYDKFVKLQREKGLYTMPSLLAGSLDTGSQFMIKGTSEPLAQKKFTNFREYVSLYPEYSCVFVGDNGQGDVRAAELVLSDGTVANHLQRAYMHIVQPLEKTYVNDSHFLTPSERRVCYFVTYIDAAIDAYNNKLIRIGGLQKVMMEALRDFNDISDDQWSPIVVGRDRSQSSTPPPPPSPMRPLKGASPEVESSNSSSAPASNYGSYFGWKLSTLLRLPRSTPGSKSLPKGKQAAAEPSKLVVGLLKKFLRVEEHNRALELGNSILLKHSLEPIPLLQYPQILPVGSVISTDFGPGRIQSFRPADGVFTVQVERSRMIIYMFGSSIG